MYIEEKGGEVRGGESRKITLFAYRPTNITKSEPGPSIRSERKKGGNYKVNFAGKVDRSKGEDGMCRGMGGRKTPIGEKHEGKLEINFQRDGGTRQPRRNLPPNIEARGWGKPTENNTPPHQNLNISNKTTMIIKDNFQYGVLLAK